MQKIAIDVMGADNGVQPIVLGVVAALKARDFQAIIVGDEEQILPLIPQDLNTRVEIIHCLDYIRMEESASGATKRETSSIYIATELVRNGLADALVSPGHSGATMSLATLRLGRIKGVSRPAICTTMPTINQNPSMILDAGANTDCKPEYLLDFAVMGYEYAKSVLNFPAPRVGLLSNGEEDTKGNELTKAAFSLLKELEYFKGNVEGRDIFNGSTDVIVCDGFSGNLVLKASEGVASAISTIIKSEVKKSILATIGALLLKGVFGALKKKVDHSEYGGAPLLGVQKVVIISHGSSNARAIECAIYQALNALDSDICSKLEEVFAKRVAQKTKDS
ncbi:phosphate acyltransferase PlsX [Helicobacter sp. MIT 00-7814]|uniref:phosphate acyltransferase PlsX n=1 Tax=unclassified Helicobacter TaxID=2593540 RepID=UPI000E1F5DB2|nr:MULTISPECIES: phosphate acyltransferase PlsX [unclassified Helicobacter]RDU53568.1 phosphate acyltransferase PlsX [Helicobacter sp. MIT 00-7814]RDU57006.1 phosphate acyltransferase PlsX [Helicobacter sp. MIT 99-10781]